MDYDGKYVIKKDQITKETETASLLPILDLIQLNINVKGVLPNNGNLEIKKTNVFSGKFYYDNYLVTLSNGKYKIEVLNATSSTDTSALEAKINDLKTELDAQKKKGSSITLEFSGSTDLSCNSTINSFVSFSQKSKSADSDDIFTYSDGTVVINKTGYYSISTYAFLNGRGYLNIGILTNDVVPSEETFNPSTTINVGKSVSSINKLKKGDIVRQMYWCEKNYTVKYATLGVTYLHD